MVCHRAINLIRRDTRKLQKKDPREMSVESFLAEIRAAVKCCVNGDEAEAAVRSRFFPLASVRCADVDGRLTLCIQQRVAGPVVNLPLD